MSGPNTAIQYSFATGIISQDIFNREDWDRRGGGIADGLNSITTPTGGQTKRPGFRFHSDCLHDDKAVRLIKFEFNESQVYMLEFGDGVMRVHTNDGVVLNAKNKDYINKTPFNLEQIMKARTCQNKDLGIYTCHDVPVQKLVRHGHADWRWSPLFQDVSRISAPTNLDFYDAYSNGHNGFEYAVTSYRMVNGAVQESIGFPAVRSDSSGIIDPIGYQPQNNIDSCIAWIKQFRASHGHIAGFPTYPESMDLSTFTYDDEEPYPNWAWNSLNGKLFRIFKIVHPTMVGSIRQSEGLGPYTSYFWGIFENGEGGPIAKYEYLLIINNTGEIAGSIGWVYENKTIRMKDQARTWLNGDLAVEGFTKTQIYNNIMSFIDYVNNSSSIKTYNRIKWSAVSGAAGYNVYRRAIDSEDPNFYLIAPIAGRTNTDFYDNIEETIPQSQVPIQGVSDFTSPNEYPAVCEFFQQRLLLANTRNKPASLFGSKSGIFTDFSVNSSDPSAGYEFEMASRQLNGIKDIVALKTLSLLTGGGDFVSTVGGAIHAGNVNFDQHSYNGTSDIPAEIIGDSAIYVPLARQTVQSMTYSFEKDGFARDNILFHCQELAEGRLISGIAYQREPINLIWVLLDDGTLLSCKYIPEQNFQSWTRHETQGKVVAIATMQDSGNVDRLWAVIRRTLGNGKTRQYIEILDDTRPYGGEPTALNSFYVDCGLTAVFNTPATTIYGLDELEGLEVAILADNDVLPMQTVKKGAITLEYPASIIHVGLPYEFRIKTLDLELLNQGTLRNASRSVWQAQVEVYRTRELLYSINDGEEFPMQPQNGDALGQELAPYTGDIQINPLPGDARHTRLTFRSTNPVPCTVKSIVAEISKGKS